MTSAMCWFFYRTGYPAIAAASPTFYTGLMVSYPVVLCKVKICGQNERRGFCRVENDSSSTEILKLPAMGKRRGGQLRLGRRRQTSFPRLGAKSILCILSRPTRARRVTSDTLNCEVCIILYCITHTCVPGMYFLRYHTINLLLPSDQTTWLVEFSH
ncbi:unnamed protein product [Ascophyllum nodosum]